MRHPTATAVFVLALTTAGCSSAYYATMEKVGVHKRDIMVDRVKAARDTQIEAKKEFADALEQFRSVVSVRGGDLEAKYEKLRGALKRSEEEAQAVRDRIASVESVAGDLFAEWEQELKKYSDQNLRRSSQMKLDLTRAKYQKLIAAMKRAEARLEPVLVPLRDQVLYLKHNLNAKAIAALDDELTTVRTGVDRLIREMEAAIAEADHFLLTLKEQ
jgi:predicted  nucleic acid-binding Zn-ribbon protein